MNRDIYIYVSIVDKITRANYYILVSRKIKPGDDIILNDKKKLKTEKYTNRMFLFEVNK